MSKRVAILQSAYIPWRGVFDFIDRVDEFILYDDVQFVKRHWHNRNQIKTANGPQWLSIPVASKGKYLQDIDETEVAGEWAATHWRSIEHAYRKAPHFAAHGEAVGALFTRAGGLARLSEVNHLFLTELSKMLGIATPFRWSSDFAVEGKKTDRLVALCRATGADAYISGPSARSYIEPDKFADAGIALEWMRYDGYQPYRQLYGEFAGGVSVIDMILNVGAEAAINQIRVDRLP